MKTFYSVIYVLPVIIAILSFDFFRTMISFTQMIRINVLLMLFLNGLFLLNISYVSRGTVDPYPLITKIVIVFLLTASMQLNVSQS
jgi:hypothetical protein